MVDNRGSRFALEVLFLVALAAVLAVATVRPLIIVGVMAAGWVLVAAVEWAVWRGQPHYGSGLPPRYYVPRLNLPPPQVLEQVRGYPEAQRDEAPTWIASAALRAEVLGEWPSAPEAPPEASDPLPVIEAQAAEPESPVVAPVKLPPVRLEPAPGTPRGRYSFDPLSEAAPKKRFGRRREPDVPELEVPARPSGRGLPGTAREQ